MSEAVDTIRFADVFACPRCGGALASALDELTCEGCGSRYPIVTEMPRFVGALDDEVSQTQEAFDYEHRRFYDSEHTRFGPQLVDQFLTHVGLPAEFFRGKRCLDVGCGSGRWSYALTELGAEVVAVDLTSGGIEALHEAIGDRPNLTIAQADIFSLPFSGESFDFVMSWGVLHHTPSTKRAFDQIVPLVRRGGTLYVMVYGADQGRSDLGTNALRWYMRRMSPAKRYDFCRHLIIRHLKLFRVLNKFMIVAYYDSATTELEPSTMQFGLYDAYSPRYNFLHTADEVVGWFRSSGYGNVTVIDAPRGAVEVRGVRG